MPYQALYFSLKLFLHSPLAAVYGRQWLEKAPIGTGIMQRLSVVSALVTVCVGLGLTTVALYGIRRRNGWERGYHTKFYRVSWQLNYWVSSARSVMGFLV